MPPTVTTADFVRRSLANCKPENKGHYDYKESVYIGCNIEIKIWCNPCQAFFLQIPRLHMNGQGCKYCSRKRLSARFKFTTEQIVTKAKAMPVHKDKYDYSRLVYEAYDELVWIGCIKCQKWFQQTPQGHLSGRGCSDCGRERTTLASMKTTEDFKRDIQGVHAVGHYCYDRVDYKGCDVPVEIFCYKCNEWFHQTPSVHLNGGGHEKCSRERAYAAIRKSHEDFIKESKAIFKDKNWFSYPRTSYFNSSTKVIITCNRCGKDFMQYPDPHLRGQDGCGNCNLSSTDSKGAINCLRYLEEKKVLGLEREVVLPNLPRRYYDFRFVYNGRWFMLEYDGDQHFRYVEHWFRSADVFLAKQEMDRLKNYIAVQQGYIMLRLSNDKPEHIARHLDYWLAQPLLPGLYVDDPAKYGTLVNVPTPETIAEEYVEVPVVVEILPLPPVVPSKPRLRVTSSTIEPSPKARLRVVASSSKSPSSKECRDVTADLAAPPIPC